MPSQMPSSAYHSPACSRSTSTVSVSRRTHGPDPLLAMGSPLDGGLESLVLMDHERPGASQRSGTSGRILGGVHLKLEEEILLIASDRDVCTRQLVVVEVEDGLPLLRKGTAREHDGETASCRAVQVGVHD